MFEKELEELGFSSNEARVFVALTELGSATPLQLSAKTGLHRAYVYDVLDRMQEKGLAATVQEGKKTLFAACKPERLVQLLESKTDAARELAPKLAALGAAAAAAGGGGARVELFKGRQTYKTLLMDVLETLKPGGEFIGLGLDEAQAMERGGFHLRRYFEIVQRKKISERIISPLGSPKAPEAKTCSYRFVDKKFLGDATVWIYGGKVAFLVYGNPDIGILIESASVADAYRKQFELLWKIARK